MKHLAVPLVVLWIFSSLAFAQMSREETVVRNAYAKLSYAVDLNTAYRRISSDPKADFATLEKETDNHGLRFALSNFKSGNLSDLANKNVDVLGQYPDGQDIVNVVLSQEHYQSKSFTLSMETASAAWVKGPEGISPDQTVGQLMPAIQRESGITSPLVRYCTYTVTATLQGRSRTYEAAFLFAADGEVNTSDVVVGIGGGALSHFVTNPVYPSILLRTHLATPAVRAFLESTQKPASNACGNGDVCCDPVTLRCGLSTAELRRLP